MTFNTLSLKYRIAAVIFVLEAVMMIMVLSLTFSSANNFVQEQVKETEATIIGLISNLSRAAFIINEYDDLQPYVEQAIQAPHIEKIMIMDHDNIILISGDSQDIGNIYDEKNVSTNGWKEQRISNATGYLGKIAIKYSHEQLQEATGHSFYIGTTAAIIGMTIIAFIGIITGNLLTRRLHCVADTAKTMSAGDLDARTQLTGSDEIAELGQAFDDMAEKLKQQIHSLTQREQELHNSREELEQRVRERTLELATASEEAIKANQAKSAFLATISHEIRTPMTAIIGFAELLEDKSINDEDHKQATDAILTSGKHLLQLITDVLDIAKIEADKLELDIQTISPADVIDPIAKIVQPIADKNHVVFTHEYRTVMPELINTDAIRLRQVLLNLLNNAIKFTENGKVELIVSHHKVSNIICLDIIDTGIGMNKEQLGRIFNKFEQADSSTTRKFGGTGLGLSLSRELVQLLGGDIAATSTPGVGSHFTIKIPCNTRMEQTNTKWSNLSISTQLNESQNLEGLRLEGHVLIVEDTEILRIMTSKTVSATGATVSYATNGIEAIKKVQEEHFDLILMDMQMPVMDGVTAVEKLRSMDIEIPIVMLTANVLKTDQLRCLEAGCDNFLAKPVKRSAIHSVLAKHLRAERPVEAQEIEDICVE